VATLVLRALFLTSTVALLACGDDTTGGGGGDGSGGASSASTGTTTATTGTGSTTTGATTGAGGGEGTGGGASSELQTLISAEWSLETGTEMYLCSRVTVEEDTWITEFHPVIPVGTHHTVVTLADPGTPDGTEECSNPFEGGPRSIYGTGVGTQPLIMPEGVAVKIAAGDQIVLNLHLFNATPETLTGTSGIQFKEVDPSQVEEEASSYLWGPLDFAIVPNGTTTDEASCTLLEDLDVFAILPHMHQKGVHLRFLYTAPGESEPVEIFDRAYDFDAQELEMYEPIVRLEAGGTITTECTWDNPTDETLIFGESSNDEMCFAALWGIPANASLCGNF
jgi:hypothetical protein